MAHGLEYRNGRFSFAYRGEGGWHGLGTDASNMSQDEFFDSAGFGYTVVKIPALGVFGAELAETEYFFTARTDNRHVFCPVTKQYKPVQPDEVKQWMLGFSEVDSRFVIDAAGVLDHGGRLWATARFENDKLIAGDRHRCYVLMSTSFDSTQATRNEATFVRTVCKNTLRAAHMGNKAVVKTRHSTRFDGAQVARDLADVLQSFEAYKVMGDALAQVNMSRDEVLRFFGAVLDIPEGAKRGDRDTASTRKWNQMDDLISAFGTTMRERNTSQGDAFTALNAVTRYVDHDRSVRGAGEDGSADTLSALRFDSATFGSGDLLKGKALGLLLPMIDLKGRDKVLIPAA